MDKPTIDVLAGNWDASNELLARVERLERQNRCLRSTGDVVLIGAAVVLIGCLVLLGCGAHPADDPKTVEAEQFMVRDRDGKVRLATGHGPGRQ